MLSYAARKALFFLFVGIFLVSAPLVVLYTAGYRFNRNNNTVLQTGTLAIASVPRGASTFINGEDIRDATPAVLQRLSTGTRTVRLVKEGYYPWERTVSVQSGATTYVTAPLFLQEDALALQPDTAAWNRAQTARLIEEVILPENIRLTPTSAGVEVYLNSHTNSTFLTLLPADSYTPFIVGDQDLFVKNSKGEVFVLSLTRAQAVQSLGKNVIAYAWEEKERLFAWTDGLEVRTFSPSNNSQELITRQGDPISALTFAHNGESLILASAQGLLGIDLTSYTDGRLHTTLFSFSEPMEAWFSEDGSTAYLATTSSLSSLPLTP
ncbi:PEGA domain-containing protein [bacterium]|nr:PEGA domain-containing protein [bacterium]NBX49487.1 PEGA domain-containing protein [bacterium]